MTNTEIREKLVELLKKTEINKINGHLALAEVCFTPNVFEKMASHLIANGVTFAKDTDAHTNWIYRVTYNGFGIYDAYKTLVGKEEWLLFLQNENNKWLPKPPHYNDTCKSYFTEKGLEQFMTRTLPIMLEKLDGSKVIIKTFKVYQDDFQKVAACMDAEGGMIMCNAFTIGMIVLLAFECGHASNIFFWILYAAAVITNTEWFRRKEEKWIEPPKEE